MLKHFVITLSLLTMIPLYAAAGQTGLLAPPFSLPDTSGKMVSLDNYRGMVVLLNFWAPWCYSCKAELPELDILHKKYGNAGLVVLGISLDDSEAGTAKFLRKIPVSFQVLLDKKGKVADTYRFSGLPAVFLIGRDRTIRYRHMGFEKEFLPIYEKEIKELLNKNIN